jgi:hypothetical protein
MSRTAKVLLLMVLATRLPAQTRTSLGDLTFELSPGWTAVQDSGALKLTPTDLQPGASCFVILRPTEALSGDFSSWFNNKWQSVLRIGSTVVQSSQPQHQANAGSDNEAIFASAVLQDAQQRTFSLILFGMRVGQRAFPLLWIASSQELLSKYQPTVQQLLGSLKLRSGSANSGGASAITPARNAAPVAVSSVTLDGPYYGLFMGINSELGQYTLTTKVSSRIFVFFPDGSVIYAPEKGLAGFDPQAALREGKLERDQYGHYKLQDGIVRISFPNNNLDISLDENGTHPGLNKYIPLCKCTGLTFDGTFKVSGTQFFMTFTHDGRFDDHGGAIRELLQYSFSEEEKETGIVGYGEKITQAGSGTFQIVNNTIMFSYSDGRRIVTSFYAPARTPEPPWFLIRDINLERVEH